MLCCEFLWYPTSLAERDSWSSCVEDSIFSLEEGSVQYCMDAKLGLDQSSLAVY